MQVKKYVKTSVPEGYTPRAGEEWLNSFGESTDENGNPVTYLIKKERVVVSHLEKEIISDEKRLEDKKLKLAALKEV